MTITITQAIEARGLNVKHELQKARRRANYRSQADRPKVFPIELITDSLEYAKAWWQLNHLKG